MLNKKYIKSGKFIDFFMPFLIVFEQKTLRNQLIVQQEYFCEARKKTLADDYV